VNRNYKEYDELEISAARDSGAIDEASDFILGIWKEKDNRPEAEQTDIKLKIGILKNRKGGLIRTSGVMDKRSLKIIEV
jgi:replicative DNA helicase